MPWFNPPADWSLNAGTLRVHTGSHTDFWRTTHYGFVRDTGHFYYETVKGDLEASVTIRGQYSELFDQAGLMIRLDERNWVKCGVEFVDGRQLASCVVTREFSDWSVSLMSGTPPVLHLRLTRRNDSVQVEYSIDNDTYTMLRLAYFPPNVPAMVGPMCCSPEGNGFDVTFETSSIRALT